MSNRWQSCILTIYMIWILNVYVYLPALVYIMPIVIQEIVLSENLTLVRNGSYLQFNEYYTYKPKAINEQEYPPLIHLLRTLNFSPHIVGFLTMLCYIFFGGFEGAKKRHGCQKVCLTLIWMLCLATFLISTHAPGISLGVYFANIGPEMGFDFSGCTVFGYVFGIVNILSGVIVTCVIIYVCLKNCCCIYTCSKDRHTRRRTEEDLNHSDYGLENITRCSRCGHMTSLAMSNQSLYIHAKYRGRKSVIADIPEIDSNEAFSFDDIDSLHNKLFGEIRSTITTLWESRLVGIGRDARGLVHRHLEITDVIICNNQHIFESYLERKAVLKSSAMSVGGRLKPQEEFTPFVTGVVLTHPIIQQTEWLKANVDNNLNEYYLFHGTKFSNLESIRRSGLNVPVTGRMLGKGIYFTDHPVKADQYTDEDSECCMLLCRVLLGEKVIMKSTSVSQNAATSPPCRTCLVNTNLPPDCPAVFDSLVYAGGLFREYVIYNSCQAYPEFIIKYRRIGSETANT